MSLIQSIVWFFSIGMCIVSLTLLAIKLKPPQREDLVLVLTPVLILSASVTALAFAVDAIVGEDPSSSIFIAFWFGAMAAYYTFTLTMKPKRLK